MHRTPAPALVQIQLYCVHSNLALFSRGIGTQENLLQRRFRLANFDFMGGNKAFTGQNMAFVHCARYSRIQCLVIIHSCTDLQWICTLYFCYEYFKIKK